MLVGDYCALMARPRGVGAKWGLRRMFPYSSSSISSKMDAETAATNEMHSWIEVDQFGTEFKVVKDYNSTTVSQHHAA